MTETKMIPNIEFLFTPVINYAIQQNKVSLVRKLSIENLSDNDLADVQVKIECEPEFTNGWEHHIDVIPSGFGSLDKESLTIVFDTIKSLRKENRIVGVISHVEEMQQEIDVHLRIENQAEKGSVIHSSWME